MVKRKRVLIVVACLAAMTPLPLVLTREYSRINSPNGRYHAVATYPIWKSFVTMTPGQSGDKSGTITIYTADGSSCGSVSVAMVSQIGDLEWSPDHAQIPAVAEWDLARGTVHRSQ